MTETSINAEDIADKPDLTVEQSLAVAVSEMLADAQHADGCDLLTSPTEACPGCSCLVGRLYEALEPAEAHRKQLQRHRVDYALRRVIEHADYDLHKGLEGDEEFGADTYPEHVTRFITAYSEAPA